MSATVSEIYNKTNIALDTLSNLWQTMLKVIEAVSATAAASLTVEPDLVELQKIRKEYELLMTTLKTTVEWLQKNPINDNELNVEAAAPSADVEERLELQAESERINGQLKRLLNQSYSLQFQLELFFTSAQQTLLK
ncbi:hypothetical protein BDF20DRAFT_820064 [Mycotypha africana]|uniref:uncharacterized protein n=1 Tax=Mycotypha africana TaxID=64632 RepID=UPI0022FFFFD7|nr:uncharacterized protein BDF20DRAFT_820064 [Mycotypha africana]KAI8979708.1 hypothetical protein BDF20DRAFT_820064 [Mycotypha africana]